jgi:pyruvate/2-oxoglutarate dehydrogenase complex dihydrolipoamide acyltransferase (E2) component
METREIKIRSFVYTSTFKDFDGVERSQQQIASKGDTVEISDYWIRYGEDMGAFVTDADREAEETDEDVLDTAETVEEMGDDELMNWVSDKTIPEILSVANADPTLCARLLDAENKATGNDPRTGLLEALTHIMAASEGSGALAETEESVEDLAKRLGVDLEQVEGTGEDDEITVDDVKEYYDEEIADATDGAVELAEEKQLFLADITGTGADGRITKDDVQKFLDKREAASE